MPKKDLVIILRFAFLRWAFANMFPWTCKFYRWRINKLKHISRHHLCACLKISSHIYYLRGSHWCIAYSDRKSILLSREALLQDGQINKVVRQKDEKGTGRGTGGTAGNVETFWRALLWHQITVSSKTTNWSWFAGNQVLEGRQTLLEEKKELICLLRNPKPYQTKPNKNWLKFIFIRPTAAQGKEKYTNQDWALRKHN